MKFLAIMSLALGSFGLSLISPATALAQTSDYSTIQERARAHRESFLEQQTIDSTLEEEPASDSIQDKIKSLEERILGLRQKTILASYDRVLTNTERYLSYLDNILSRLDLSLAELNSVGENSSTSEENAAAARELLTQASTTIAVARASTTEIFISADPSQTVREIKAMIEEVVIKLGQARSLISEAIEAAKITSDE